MELIREYIYLSLLLEQKTLMTEEMSDIKTVGDLKKLIFHAQNKKRLEQGKSAAKTAVKDAFWNEVTGKVPGLAAAKTLFDAMKTTYELPDEKRTGTALDYLDVDDDVSAIVDDPIENKFLKILASKIDKMNDNTPLKSLNMTKLLSRYISNQFNARTVAGFDK